MSEFTALAQAARASGAGPRAPPASAEAARAPDLLRAGRGDARRLRGELRLQRAGAAARQDHVRERARAAGDALGDFATAAEDAVLSDHIVTYITQSHSVKELFDTSPSRLTAEGSTLKEETLTNLQNLRQLEMQLSTVDCVIREKEQEISKLRKEWEGVLTQLTELNVQVSDSASEIDTEENRDTKKLKEYVYKMEQMRQFTKKFIPITDSNYNWNQDNANLMGFLAGTREPITVETFTKD